jgi:hypothetical protein
MKSSIAERPEAPGRNKTTPAWVSTGCWTRLAIPLSSVNRMRPFLVEDRVGVPGQMQIRNKIDRQGFVVLEFHRTWKGINVPHAPIRQHKQVLPRCFQAAEQDS